MAETDVVTLINAIPSLIEHLSKAFSELESHENASVDKAQFKEIQEHFRKLEAMVVDKCLELDIREKAFSEQESHVLMLVKSREAKVATMEQDLLDRIQKLKDAAASAISEARGNHKLTQNEPVDVGDSEDSQVSSSLGDSNAFHTGSEVKSPHETGQNAGVKPRSELMQICEKMDAKGLLNFIMGNQKSVTSICKEVALALPCATEPGRLVLASLEGFYSPDESNENDEKNIDTIQGLRRSCLVCIKAMATLLAKADPGSDSFLYPEIKQQAKAIADEWKPKVANAGTGSASENSLETEAFLQLLATFKIASEFDEEELCKLVLAGAHKRQGPELFRSLGLTHKISGVVESLISSGKQIDAAHFIHAFQLTESFPIAPLLKTHLKDLRRSLQGKGGSSGNAENNANAQELAALKDIIQCIKEYNLEADYPVDPLQRRIAQLESAKTNYKKRSSAEPDRPRHPKKPHTNGPYGGSRGSSSNPSLLAHAQGFGGRAAYGGGVSERYPPPSAYDYQAPNTIPYPQQAAYDPRAYYLPPDERVAPTSASGYVGSAMPGTARQPYI